MAPPGKKRGAAPSTKRTKKRVPDPSGAGKKLRVDPSTTAEQVLRSKKNANLVFDLLELLESEEAELVLGAVAGCKTLFCGLLEEEQLFQGALPGGGEEEEQEEEAMMGSLGPEDKYRLFMRLRYSSCVETLLELLDHENLDVRDSALCCLMDFVGAEGRRPLQDLDGAQHGGFPRRLLSAVVEKLLSSSRDTTALSCSFQRLLLLEDVRYHVMIAVRGNLATVMAASRGAVMPVYQNNAFALMCNINMPSKESELVNFLVPVQAKHEECKAAKLTEQRRAFEKMWLVFLKYQLPSSLYKKVLVRLHDSILPHLLSPSLLLDFLCAAYDVGGAISLLALNGLFVLIHQHNLDFPDFYLKLYNLLEPSVLHARYRARFFHLADLFLSSSHLPAYLVAAFAKRLSRLALVAPPTALLILLPFIYNLIRRHPSCRLLLHKPGSDEPVDDPYLADQTDPAQCRALDSSLWEVKTLQQHHHPGVAKAALLVSSPLRHHEDDLSGALETTMSELMEAELQQEVSSVPLEFEAARQLLQGGGGVLGRHFCLATATGGPCVV